MCKVYSCLYVLINLLNSLVSYFASDTISATAVFSFRKTSSIRRYRQLLLNWWSRRDTVVKCGTLVDGAKRHDTFVNFLLLNKCRLLFGAKFIKINLFALIKTSLRRFIMWRWLSLTLMTYLLWDLRLLRCLRKLHIFRAEPSSMRLRTQTSWSVISVSVSTQGSTRSYAISRTGTRKSSTPRATLL